MPIKGLVGISIRLLNVDQKTDDADAEKSQTETMATLTNHLTEGHQHRAGNDLQSTSVELKYGFNDL